MAKHEVGHCAVCDTQWQIRAPSDKKRCPFCGAPKEAITIEDETNPQDRGA